MTFETTRSEIDQLDAQIIALLEKRREQVLLLKQFKDTLTDPLREQEILSKIHSPYIQSIYKKIFQSSKQLLLDAGFQQKEKMF